MKKEAAKFQLESVAELKKNYIFIFREMGGEGEGDGEKHRCMRETDGLLLAYALTRN